MSNQKDEAFEKAYESVIDSGWMNVKHLMRQVWDKARTEQPAPARVVMSDIRGACAETVSIFAGSLDAKHAAVYMREVLLSEVARLNASTAAHGWISVEDRLPVEGSKDEYLIYCSTGAVAMSDYVYDEQCGWGFWYDPDATHWMPLPPPPAQRTGGAE